MACSKSRAAIKVGADPWGTGRASATGVILKAAPTSRPAPAAPRLCSSLCTVLPHDRAHDAAVRPWSVLRRWNAGLKLGWRMASGFLDRVSRRSPASRVPVLSVEVSAAALLLHFDTAALTTLLGVAAVVMHFGQYSRHRRLRPQVTCTPAACGDCNLLRPPLVHHAHTHQSCSSNRWKSAEQLPPWPPSRQRSHPLLWLSHACQCHLAAPFGPCHQRPLTDSMLPPCRCQC